MKNNFPIGPRFPLERSWGRGASPGENLGFIFFGGNRKGGSKTADRGEEPQRITGEWCRGSQQVSQREPGLAIAKDSMVSPTIQGSGHGKE